MSADELAAYLRTDFPALDGSTSTILMDKAIRTAILGDGTYVIHSKTYQALDDLTSKNRATDMLLSVKYGQDYLERAKSDGIDLAIIPVAKEGFVFLVNKDNPVDTISQDDLRRIYSGEITNWKELGGPNAPIMAYQRNTNSGSQTAMVDFMGDTPLAVAQTETILMLSEMEGLVDVLADYDNGLYAIGYSVYSFAAKQYTGGGNVKLVHVDGVEPNDITLGDNTYPIVVYTYSYYDKNSPKIGRAHV
jgi:phosphate transport system substrate-binding protein